MVAAFLLFLGAAASVQADTALPGSLWTAPMGLPGATTVAPNGGVLVASCETSGNPSELVDQRLAPDGNPLWQLFRAEAYPGGCPGLVSDAGDNTYLLGLDSQQHSVAQAVDQTGHIRWATPTGNASGGGNSPVLGANGSVFFEAFDGIGAFVLGFGTTSGTATYHQNLAGIAGLHAFQSGLAEVSDDDGVAYYGYDGSLISIVDPTPAITNSEPSANTGGAAGTVFIAGYAGSCRSSPLSVSKITPAGRAWTWTDTSAACGGISIAATPDGGVVLSVSTGEANGSLTATSLSVDGALRRQQTIAGAERNGISQVLVDANGVVALQSHYEYPDPSNPSVLHLGVKVQFLSGRIGESVFPAIEATDPSNGDFQMSLGGGASIGAGRVYIPESGSAPGLVSAYSVPGLGQDYQSVLQASLTASSSGGGSPPGADDGGLTVQPPSPTPPLTVTVASGGGDGAAGAPDPSSFEHGLCDPGSDTNWLHIAGITFTCIVSLQFWSEPGLITAKDRCIVNLAVTFVPFARAFTVGGRFVRQAKTVKAALQVLAREIASATYPGKSSSDAQAIDDIQTGLDAILNPNQALLAIVSSRRVLDGLLTKLAKGGAGAAKAAHDLAVVKTAVTSLIKTAAGIQTIEDCVAAFNGP